jgi:hypothetical protein
MNDGIAVAVCIWLLLATPVRAQDLIPVADAVRLVADGRPWNGQRPGGDAIRLTLRPDGTGRFEGPLTRDVTWDVRDGALCIVIGFPLGTKCLGFERRGRELTAYEGRSVAFVLFR